MKSSSYSRDKFSTESPLVILFQELIDCQGPPADVGGYYKVDPAKAESAMRPSKKFNELIDNY